MKYEELKREIDAKIFENRQQLITGDILNGILNKMVSAFGRGYQFGGEVTPDTTISEIDEKMVFLAMQPGTYTSFGDITVEEGEIALIEWSNNWKKTSLVNDLDTFREAAAKLVGVSRDEIANWLNVYDGVSFYSPIHALMEITARKILLSLEGEEYDLGATIKEMLSHISDNTDDIQDALSEISDLTPRVERNTNRISDVESQVDEHTRLLDARYEDIQHLDSELSDTNTRVAEVHTLANNAIAIAEGKATGYVFATKEAMDSALGEHEFTDKLHMGDNLYILALDVPDYWWDGSQARELETQKVDLSDYLTSEQIASLYATKEEVAEKQDKTFYAGYNRTTYEEIKQAYEAGKDVVCLSGGRIYRLTFIATERAVFSCVFETVSNATLYCTKENVWSVANTTLQRKDRIQSVITESDENYPSSKAVIDYVREKTNMKVERVELEYHNGVSPYITYLGKAEHLTFDQIVSLVSDEAKFVTLLWETTSFLLPQYFDGAAIIFTGVSVMGGSSTAIRVAMSIDGEFNSYAMDLANTSQTNLLAELVARKQDSETMRTVAEFLCNLDSRVLGIEGKLLNGLDKLKVGHLFVGRELGGLNQNGSFNLQGSGAPSADSIPTNWDFDTYGDWKGIPQFISQTYIDTTNKIAYMAVGVDSISDWKRITA